MAYVFVEESTRRTVVCRQLGRSRTIAQQFTAKAHHDECHREAIYLPGDLVLLYFPLREVGRCTKFLPKCQGPYRILRQTSPVNYVVQPVHPPSDRRAHATEVVHVSRLKTFQER